MELQQTAAAHCRSTANPSRTAEILGSIAKDPSDLEKAFWRMLWSKGDSIDPPPIVQAMLPLRKGEAIVNEAWPLILPSDWFHDTPSHQLATGKENEFCGLGSKGSFEKTMSYEVVDWLS